MSVIGPRPLLVEYLPYYTKEEHHRHDVRPGLSGWAQINGRNAIDSWEQRFQYDLEYVICNPWLCDDGGIPVSSRITGTGGFYSFSTGNQRNPMEQGIDFQIYLTFQSDASVIMCGSKKRRESCLCNGKPGTWKN